MAASYPGQCHCGAIGFDYSTDLTPQNWSVRACQCSFCRAHGAHYTSDANGSVSFRFSKPDALERYRFGLRTADFLVCRNCGVFIGAVLTTGRGSFAALNLNALITPVQHGTPESISFDAESRDARVDRRETRWTPVLDAG